MTLWKSLRRSCRRTPHGVRGLKSVVPGNQYRMTGRTPHGVRGLKFQMENVLEDEALSHPSRGAWIEIANAVIEQHTTDVAPLTGCVD